MMDSSSLSWSTRVKGFIICFVVGFAFSIFGSLLFFLGNTVGFGICYTFGSVVSIFSTMFLMGPVNQIKKMFHGTRVIAALIMWASIVLTLFFAFKTKKRGTCIAIRHYTIFSHDLVLPVLYPICTRRCQEILCWSLPLRGMRKIHFVNYLVRDDTTMIPKYCMPY